MHTKACFKLIWGFEHLRQTYKFTLSLVFQEETYVNPINPLYTYNILTLQQM